MLVCVGVTGADGAGCSRLRQTANARRELFDGAPAPPKPLKAPSAARLVFGMLVPAVAVVGVIVWMSSIGHSGAKAKSATPAAPAQTGTTAPVA